MKRKKKPKNRNPVAKAVTKIKPKVIQDNHKTIISSEDYEERLRDFYQDRWQSEDKEISK